MMSVLCIVCGCVRLMMTVVKVKVAIYSCESNILFLLRLPRKGFISLFVFNYSIFDFYVVLYFREYFRLNLLVDFQINSSNGEELLVYKPVKKGNGQIFMSTVGVQFRVAPKYFKFGVLEIKCEATLLDQKFSTKQNITHQNYQPPFYTENRYSSGDGGKFLINIGFLLQLDSHFVNKYVTKDQKAWTNSQLVLIFTFIFNLVPIFLQVPVNLALPGS